MNKRNAFTILVFFLTIAHCFAEEWFVRPAGMTYGTGDGTSHENAWSGFSRIVWGTGGVESTHTLYICGTFGSGRENRLHVGISGASNEERLTIRGDYPGDPGIFDGSSWEGIRFGYDVPGHSGYMVARNNLNIVGLTFRNGHTGLFSSGGSHNITVEACKFVDLGLKGAVFAGSYPGEPIRYADNIWVKNSEFVNIGNWGDRGGSSLSYHRGARNTLTEDCIFKGDGANYGVDGILIENMQDTDGNNHVIRRNVFSGHYENGIDFKGSGPSPAGEGPSRVYENVFYNQPEQAHINIHFGARDIIIERNSFLDGHSGIAFPSKLEDLNDGYVTIQYNLFANLRRHAIFNSAPGGLGNNKIVNNTIYRVGFDNTKNFSIQINTNDWVIKNNIFYHLSMGRSPHSSIWFRNQVDMSTIEVDNNCHFLYSGLSAYRMPDNSYRTVEQVERNGFQADPSFRDASNSIFLLQEMSPGIAGGVSVPGIHPTLDLAGILVESGGVIDMGAYSFVDNDLGNNPKDEYIDPHSQPISISTGMGPSGSPNTRFDAIITLQDIPTERVFVRLFTTDGTAISGRDYRSVNTTLSFLQGLTTQDYTLTVLPGGSGQFTITAQLLDADGVLIAEDTCTAMIDNELTAMPEPAGVWVARISTEAQLAYSANTSTERWAEVTLDPQNGPPSLRKNPSSNHWLDWPWR